MSVRGLRRGALVAGVALSAPLLGGCVVAAIPIMASSAMVKKQMDAKRKARGVSEPAAIAAPVAAPTEVAAAPRRPAPPVTGAVAPVPVTRGAPPPGMQYLYGSGEGAAASQQAYRQLTTYLESIRFRQPDAMRQVVVNDGSSLADPYFEPCGKKPPAVVLDIDETALLNLGYEADEAARGLTFDQKRWDRWEATGASQVAAVPGAKAAIDRARALGIAVIFNSNRTVANAAATEAALAGAGLGPAKHGETLWLRGDDGGGSGKDDRRWAIASGYCVVALVGDQLGDFSDLFNDPAMTPPARRALANGAKVAALWGNGWFVLPNPVYGTALKGGIDEVFPTDKRWVDPGASADKIKE